MLGGWGEGGVGGDKDGDAGGEGTGGCSCVRSGDVAGRGVGGGEVGPCVVVAVEVGEGLRGCPQVGVCWVGGMPWGRCGGLERGCAG